MNTPLKKLQNTIVERLSNIGLPESLPILKGGSYLPSERLEQDIKTSYGISIVVLRPVPQQIVKNAPGPQYEQASISIAIHDYPFTNLENLSSLEIAERIASSLHHWKINKDGWLCRLAMNASKPWEQHYDKQRQTDIITLHFSTASTL